MLKGTMAVKVVIQVKLVSNSGCKVCKLGLQLCFTCSNKYGYRVETHMFTIFRSLTFNTRSY